MAPKDLKNTWVCKHGCSNKQTPCKHLEALISPKDHKKLRGNGRGVNILFTDNLEKFEKQMVPQFTEEGQFEEIGALRDKLQGYILTLDEEVVLVGRHALNESFEDLGMKLGCSRQRAWAVYKQAINKLKEQGYK